MRLRKTLSASLVAGRYRLERELARGGMGSVWLAEDQKLARFVAIKVMSQELAQMSEALQRFEREAMAVAGLRSTHVVEVYDYGVQEDLPYIVMELLEGENLSNRLRRTPYLELVETTRVVVQMCKGLKAAHAAQLIHRDLKPSNIFLARRDDEEVVKLLDFGVVKELQGSGSSDATVTGLLLGTPQYMSPEQARATREIDHRSDLWSVAVVAFRMLTGANPFRGESVGDVVLKICSDALPSLTDHRTDLPPYLSEFFERAFQRDPNARFQSAAELAAALDGLTRRALGQAPNTRPMRLTEPSIPPRPNDPATAPLGAMTPLPQASLTGPPAPGVSPFPRPSQPSMSSAPSAPSLGAPRGSMPSISLAHPSYDTTPVSTTVGGTQVAPYLSSGPPPNANSSVAFVVGGAATLIAVALVVAVWLGSGDAVPSPGVSPRPASESPAMTVTDGASNHAAASDPSASDPLSDPTAPASALPDPSSPADPETPKSAQPASAKPSTMADNPRPSPAAPNAGPQPTAAEPKPSTAPRPAPARPDWGLGEDG